MSHQFLGSLTASALVTFFSTTPALSQTLPAPETVAVSQPAAATPSSLARVLTHPWGGTTAATLYIRSIPVLTFVATPEGRNPQDRAIAIANRLNALNENSLDASAISVAWNDARQAYLIAHNGEELTLLDGKQVILPDTTRDATQDAIQATNRLRRLLGNAAPLRPEGLSLRPEPAVALPSPQVQPQPRVVSRQQGLASWYGPGFHGRLSASGERFNQNAMTAAHRTLPFGTRVRVTNRNNGRSIVVRINDRGPFIRGRIIDLSVGAAKQIGMYGSGIAPVEVEILGR